MRQTVIMVYHHNDENGMYKYNKICYNKGAEKVVRGLVFNKSERQTDQGSFSVPHNVAIEI